ncbi:MAG: hypothetical protein OXH28_06665 [bacterium]|nr:hypothetical protein [bacterium]
MSLQTVTLAVDGTGVVEAAVASAGVVTAVDPDGEVAACVGPILVLSPMAEFVLQGGEERLDGGVVQGTVGASHGPGAAHALAGLRERRSAVLPAAVGAKDRNGEIASTQGDGMEFTSAAT